MLENEKQLILELKQLKEIPVDLAYLRGFKRVLETKMSLTSRPKTFIPRIWRFSFSFSSILIGAVFLGYLSVLATQNIPADNILYPVRLAGEKLQLGLQGFDRESKTDLMLRFAENRLSEIRALEEKDYSDSRVLRQFLNDYYLEMVKIQEEILSVNFNVSSGALVYLLKIESRLAQISDDLGTIRFDADEPGGYSVVENMLVFMRDLVSRRIFEAELQLKSYSQDERKWERMFKEYSRLQSRALAIENNRLSAFSSNQDLATEINLRLVSWQEEFKNARRLQEEDAWPDLGLLILELEMELARLEVLES